MNKADTLKKLHRPGDPVVLPNAWDAASARAVEAAGFPAVATSSAAVALSLGYADGEATPVQEMLDAVARIARAVGVPVTADIERGYWLPPAELAERLLATGAVGCNLEDSDPRTKRLIDVDRHADFLAEVRQAAGDDLVINARVDAYLRVRQDPLPVALERARRFGTIADCVYPIGASAKEDIAALAEVGRTNILFTNETPALAELAALNVARVSFGDGIHEALAAEHARMLAAIVAGASPYRK
ncbi:2-Methylisocitrate lyase, PEP mutase family [Asanoa hainanensis]|uniref:2-Methylisocitrate lyase, PEP mutase family n=1 Tax=Asanoa hainanensis TaxID=560556 RepID=A0A239LAA7_9ACTN|nr:isocitrate lyase/phosphoenolpyruvate mutase family protein [Asanoa hainanensis]SNT27587.1 2-Methylisocitrate lyase, PEP mutase family [Asanoa hainanensis]